MSTVAPGRGDVTGAMLQRLVSEEGVADPYAIYEDLRQVRSRGGDIGRIVLGFEECMTVLGNPMLGSERVGSIMAQLSGETAASLDPLCEVLSAIVAFRDPPDHDRIRGLLRRAFLPSVVRRQHHLVEEVADHLIAAMPDCGTADVRAALTHPLPALVMARMLGVPESDLDRFNRWANDVVMVVGSGRPDGALAAHALESVEEMQAYMGHLVAKRRREPAEDLLTGMVQASEEGDRGDGRALSEVEILANALFLMTAGHETATNLLNNGIVTLLAHPEQVELLRQHPNLLPAAVEEVLRYQSPVQMTARIALGALQVGDVRLAEGQALVVLLGAANRDPAAFERPEVFDVTRAPSRHLAFSSGVHYCLGAHLARQEAQVVWRRLLFELADLELADPVVPWQPTIDFRGPTAVPLAWSGRRTRT